MSISSKTAWLSGYGVPPTGRDVPVDFQRLSNLRKGWDMAERPQTDASGTARMVCRTLTLAASLLLAAGTLAAQDQGTPMPQQPALPATSEENWTVKRFKLQHATSIYDTWTTKRKKIAQLPPRAVVSGLRKLSVVYEPDVVTITAAMPQLALSAGDTILRYTYEGEGFADFWIKGRWYKEFDGSFITEQDGNGCSKKCSGEVTKPGRKEEWSNVRLSDGRVGWFREY